MGRAKRSKGRAGEAGDLALHIVVNKIVVANPGKVAQGTRVQPDDARTADHVFPAGVRIHAENNQGQTIAGAGAAAEARQQFREIFLVQQAQRGIIHLANDDAIVQFLRAASIEEFFLQVSGSQSFRG